jgi:hypothetical protein
MELANLFKELMKRGWKVYWEYDELMSYWQTRWKRDFWFWVLWETKYSLRELVSKESGLWQFVCENKLVKEDCSSIELYIISEWYWIITDSYYQFWLMMCSLKDESELEKFLLDNIEVEWK